VASLGVPESFTSALIRDLMIFARTSHDSATNLKMNMERDFTRRGHHDMGGLEAGPVEQTEHDYALWEKRVDALMKLLTGPDHKRMTVDQLRKGIESLPPDAYEKMSYYERWIFSITQALQHNGVLTTEELSRKLDEVQARAEAEGA